MFAGTDTTSNALGRVLQMLAEHPEAQSRLREELAGARDYHGQDIPYDRLVELPFLDAICRETLRLYVPLMLHLSLCSDDFVRHSPVNVVPRESVPCPPRNCMVHIDRAAFL